MSYFNPMLYSRKKILPFLCLFITVVSALNSYSQELTKEDTSNVRFLNSRKFYIYKVEKGETLYSISQKFKIPQEEIKQFNKEIESEGLKAKMKLWIPAYSWQKNESAKVVQEPELKKAVSVLNIAVISFLNLPKTYTAIDTSSTYIEEPLNREIKENLEFIEGAMLSAEEFKNQKVKIHLHLVDSENDSIKVLRKLKKIESLDAIITNEFGGVLKNISAYSKINKVILISCAINTYEVIKNNEYAYSLFPSSGKQCEQMGKFSGMYFNNSVLLTVKSGSIKENERTSFFRSGWTNSGGDRKIEIDYSKGSNDVLADSLLKNKTNVIFLSSSNEDYVSSILNNLNTKILDHNVRVVGLPTWQYFETIDFKLIENCNVYLFSSGFIDFSNAAVTEFRKKFRDKYSTEPLESAYQEKH
jgi:LysM repeat protein